MWEKSINYILNPLTTYGGGLDHKNEPLFLWDDVVPRIEKGMLKNGLVKWRGYE